MDLALCFCAATCATLTYAQDFNYGHAYAPPYESGKFGWSIAATEEWTVIGAPFADGDSGEVRVYPTTAFLTGAAAVPDLLPYDATGDSTRRLGGTVAVHGDIIAVGNCSAQGGGEYCEDEAPWVSLFEHNGDSWQSAGRIVRPATASGRFGVALALHDEWLAIGGARKGPSQAYQDVVYLYRWNGTSFNLQPEDSLTGDQPPGADGDHFGFAIAMSTDHLLIGARGDDELGTDAGAAYVFASDGGITPRYGDLVRKLLASDGGVDDGFGFSVAIRGDACAVGAPQKDFNGKTIGCAYAFDRNEGFTDNWGQVAVLVPDQPSERTAREYGASVALSTERIAVGAPQDSLYSDHIQGTVRVFKRQDPGWAPQTVSPRTDGHVNDVGRCGTAVALVGGGLLIGAPWAIIDNASAFPTGGVLVYADPLLSVQERPLLQARIWPVPATDHLMVQAEAPYGTPLRLVLRDATGRTVSDNSFSHANAPSRIDLAAFPPGAYTIEVTDHGTAGSFRSIFIHR